MKDEIKITQDELDILLICSVRYALHRSTYIVGDVVELIDKYAKQMSDIRRDVIIKDISCYFDELTENDDECDIEEWRKALELLK